MPVEVDDLKEDRKKSGVKADTKEEIKPKAKKAKPTVSKKESAEPKSPKPKKAKPVDSEKKTLDVESPKPKKTPKKDDVQKLKRTENLKKRLEPDQEKAIEETYQQTPKTLTKKPEPKPKNTLYITDKYSKISPAVADTVLRVMQKREQEEGQKQGLQWQKGENATRVFRTDEKGKKQNLFSINHETSGIEFTQKAMKDAAKFAAMAHRNIAPSAGISCDTYGKKEELASKKAQEMSRVLYQEFSKHGDSATLDISVNDKLAMQHGKAVEGAEVKGMKYIKESEKIVQKANSLKNVEAHDSYHRSQEESDQLAQERKEFDAVMLDS